jgi:hypothetical protein
MAVLCLVAMVWYNTLLALIFALMMLGVTCGSVKQRQPVSVRRWIRNCVRSPEEAKCIKRPWRTGHTGSPV